jgi:hypothetical protein
MRDIIANILKPKQWRKIKAKAPKVPKYTCPQIDAVLEIIEKLVKDEKHISQWNHDRIMKKMEKIRTANDQLRESGIYWYEVSKNIYNPD